MGQIRDGRGRFVGSAAAVDRAGATKARRASGVAAPVQVTAILNPEAVIAPRQLRAERRDEFTAAKKAIFMAVLSETSNVTTAAKVAGVTPVTAYRHRRLHADFASQWEKALADAIADLTMLVAHQGRFGQISEYSSRIDDEGVRHVRWKRQISIAALRTLTLCAGRAATSDADDRAAAERREAEIEIEAATRAMMQRIRELSDGGDTQH